MDRRTYILFLILFASLVFFGIHIIKAVTTSPPFVDFNTYYASAKDFLGGSAIYPNNHGYLYPIAFVMLISPLGHLHVIAAEYCWIVLNLLLLSASLAILLKSSASEIEFRTDRRLYVLSALIMTVTFRPITFDLLVGNVSSLILLLVSLGFYYLEKKKYFKSGIFIGIAASLKLAPLLIVSLHIMRNKYIAIVAVIATIALILLLPTTKYGVNSNFSQVRTYVDQVIIPYVTHPNVTTFYANQSASAVICRYLSPSDAADAASPVRPIYVNIMSLSPRSLQIIGAIARLSILSATFLTLMLYRKSYDLLPYQYSLILLTMPLISSLAWIHHYVVMLFPMLALLKDAIAGKWKLFFPLSVAMLLMSGTTKVVVGFRMSVVFSAYGLTFLAGMIIYGTTLYILWNNYMQGRRCGTGESLSLKSGQ